MIPCCKILATLDAYCACPKNLLTEKGRADKEHVYAFNVSNIGSTTSKFKRSYFYDNFAKDGFELLFVDKDIGDEHALLKEHGRYWWNENGTVFEPAE